MKHRESILIICTFIICLICPGCKSEQKIALSFNPQEGKKYEFTQEVVQDIEMDNFGQKTNMKNSSVFVYHAEIKEKDGKNFIMATTITHIKFNMATGFGNDVVFDSKDSASATDIFSSLFGKIFGSMVNKPITVVVAKNGTVVSVSGMKEIFEDIVKNTGWDTVPQTAQLAENFKSKFGEDFFAKSFGEMFNVLPDNEIAVGDTWEKQLTKTLMEMDVITKTKNELKDINNNNAVINVMGDISLQQQSKNQSGMVMSGTQTGSMKIDIATGLIVESDITHNLTGNYIIQQAQVPFKLTGTSKITSKEIK